MMPRIVASSCQPSHEKRRGPVPEVVFAGAFPEKMPRVLRIDPQDAAPAAVHGPKRSGVGLFEGALAEANGVLVFARLSRHEPDTVERAVRRVAEAVHSQPRRVLQTEFRFDRYVRERVGRIGSGDAHLHVDERIGIGSRLAMREGHAPGSGLQADPRECQACYTSQEHAHDRSPLYRVPLRLGAGYMRIPQNIVGNTRSPRPAAACYSERNFGSTPTKQGQI